MNVSIGKWFEQQKGARGFLAAGIRTKDDMATVKTWDGRFKSPGLENSLRCVADIYRVLQLNGVAPARLRLVYQNSWVYCEQAADGSCLVLFTVPDENGCDASGVDRLIQEFRVMSGLKRP